MKINFFLPGVNRGISGGLKMIGNPNWYKLNKNISQIAVKNYNEKYIRNADVSIATAVSTAYPVYKLSEEKGKKFYLIQDYEKWRRKNRLVYADYLPQEI